MATGVDEKSTDNFSKFVKDSGRPQTLGRRIKQKILRALPKEARKLLDPDPEDRLRTLILAFAKRNKGAFFVQIGACDGRSGDFLRELVPANQWRGIVVEPVPSNFASLIETYRDVPDVTPKNVAVGERDGKVSFFSVNAPKDVMLPDWTREIGSFYRSHLSKHAAMHPNLEKYITEIEVQSLTFETLVKETGETSVDFIQTDAEGYDYEILKQIDFERWKPKMILYEDFHLSEPDRKAARTLLGGAGYQIVHGSMNSLAILDGN